MSAFQRNIQNVVVLMLENRSFDHMLGFLGRGDGLRGTETNPDCVAGGQDVVVSKDATYDTDFRADPSHSFADINVQLFGPAGVPNQGAPTNVGFVANYRQQPNVSDSDARKIMRCFNPARLPAMTTLANEFVICDRWFSSVPAQTWPNRFFVHAATSMGHIDNKVRPYPAKTIFDSLTTAGEDWAIYFHDIPQSLMLSNLQKSKYRKNFKVFGERFKADCKTGLLPSYSFIEPRYFDFMAFKANDQHPPHNVALGDALIADVYNTLRQSPVWTSTLLVILWDEHGGIYDHVEPPATVNPDGLANVDPPFDFTRLGLRVPALLISPYVKRGVVDSTVYDHSSVPASIKDWLELPNFLTRRDAKANTFEHLITDDCRDDTPARIASVAEQVTPTGTSGQLTPNDVDAMAGARSTEALSEFQESLIALTKQLPPLDDSRLQATVLANQPSDEHSGAVHVRQAVQLFLAP